MRNTSGRANSALVLLCVVQGLERLAFAATLPLFVLYLHHRHGFGEPTALLFVGVFHGLSYVCGLPGGMFADRVIGSTKSLVAGAALLACGYAALAIDCAGLLWPACLVMVVGHGLFRPAMATLLGLLAPDDDSRANVHFCGSTSSSISHLWSGRSSRTDPSDCISGDGCSCGRPWRRRWQLWLAASRRGFCLRAAHPSGSV